MSKSIKVLIVEDYKEWADDLENIIKGGKDEEGYIPEIYDIRKATSKTTAQKAVIDWKPDLIMLDRELDDGDKGFELIKDFDSQGLKVPVIIISSNVKDLAEIKDYIRYGVFSYFNKTDDLYGKRTQIRQDVRDATSGKSRESLIASMAETIENLSKENDSLREKLANVNRKILELEKRSN